MFLKKLKENACFSGACFGEKPEGTGAQGVVFNIQHFTVHDGPGIRTEVFLKGCSLHCKWCSNPESIRLSPEIGVHASRCIGIDTCGYCLMACTECERGAFLQRENRIAGIDREVCTACGQCVEACPSGALSVWGTSMSVAKVMDEVRADVSFYETSGGGVTVSGGEALVQHPFVVALFTACRKEGIHTCLETALHCSPEVLREVYPLTDLVITDIKHMSTEMHRRYTGVGNERILENIILTHRATKPLVIRVPVVPRHNDDEENIRATAAFIANQLNNEVLQVQLLPYRPLGVEKYTSLGLDYPMEDAELPDLDARNREIERLVGVMRSYGNPAVVGADTKYT